MSAGEHLSPQQFWRAHPHKRPFSPDDAYSREWGSDRTPDRGYSAVRSPDELFMYFNPSERDDARSYIVNFTGKVHGTGADSEPLVVPDMKHVRKMDWYDLEKHVGEDRVRDIDRSNGWDEGA